MSSPKKKSESREIHETDLATESRIGFSSQVSEERSKPPKGLLACCGTYVFAILISVVFTVWGLQYVQNEVAKGKDVVASIVLEPTEVRVGNDIECVISVSNGAPISIENVQVNFGGDYQGNFILRSAEPPWLEERSWIFSPRMVVFPGVASNSNKEYKIRSAPKFPGEYNVAISVNVRMSSQSQAYPTNAIKSLRIVVLP